MNRQFKTADYEATLNSQIRLGDALPPEHLARFIVDVVAQLDLGLIYRQYSTLGAPPYAPELLLALLFYAYATGVFSSRQIERATYESLPFRYIAGNLHPDHDTIAHFRKTFLSEIRELFVQILLLAQAMGHLNLGNISLDGSKIHADASKSQAVSYKRLLALEQYLQAQVTELLALAARADKQVLPEGLVIEDEVARREARLAQLAQAKAVLAQRAQARYEAEKAEYEEKMRQREAKAAQKGKNRKAVSPKHPSLAPEPKTSTTSPTPNRPL